MRFCLNKAETIVAVITVQSVRRVRLKKKRMQAEKCAGHEENSQLLISWQRARQGTDAAPYQDPAGAKKRWGRSAR